MKSPPEWHKEHNRAIIKRPRWTKTAHLAKTKKMIWGLIFDNKNILTCYRVIPAQVTQFSKKSPGDHLRFGRNFPHVCLYV